jgi:peptide/nickel transport system permease protein
MAKFFVRRLLQLIPILFGLSILIFAWVRALPGGPETALLGEHATPERIAEVHKAYGFDRPLVVQYFSYVKKLASLDLGQSITSRRDVTEELRRRFPATIELSAAAMVFAVALGIPLGFYAAKRHATWIDHWSVGASLLGVSVPVFFLAYLLKWAFAVKLHWLPSIGRLDARRDLVHHTNFNIIDSIIARDPGALIDTIRHLILPGVALGAIPLAIIARITRASVLEVVNEDYVRTAKAKGMSGTIVDRRHILKNALLPITTVVGLQVGLLLSGAVLTETVFAWGGMGQLVASAVLSKDYPVLQGGILFLAIIFVVVNLFVDMMYAVIDPRIRVR